ncbi:MAG: BrnA antitoxin family protein [Rhodocyclaceae bacterium]|jgi:hypothetical protein|nr:BrnA antitoxin family protein [Rhodocyclaceae bacterium]MCA3154604.1 BrnA antitoxin family protein [Burkholderiales bacterium]MCA3643383.1 BrnA antitoxin family protein [Methylobacterium sp.]MCA3076963.1 BrnA antitoxin family protein [Rhodocyclaceae bacterium]MCA3090338.1 BrnA antitoxin family protein [Rhodocyclaceae bacterium]
MRPSRSFNRTRYGRPFISYIDVVQRFRATGDGWQTRVDAALQGWLKTHKPAKAVNVRPGVPPLNSA